MKRFFAFFLAVMVLVGSAVPAFALGFSDIPFCKLEDDIIYLKTFDTVHISSANKDFMREWFAIATGGSSTNNAFSAIARNDKGVIAGIYFFIVPKAAKITAMSGTFNISCSGSDAVRLYWFSHTDGVFTGATGITVVPNAFTYANYSVFTPGSIAFPSGVDKISLGGHNVAFVDNDGLFGDDDSSEPEPPSSSSVPDPVIPPHVPGEPPPSVSGSSPYVPYDLSVWDDFIAYLRTAAGSATNIIFLILAPLAAIPLIVSIFKHFTSGGKGDGSGGKTV